MRILSINIGIILYLLCFSLSGQNIVSKNNLIGVWSDKNFLDSLNSHNSLTLAFQNKGNLYNGLYIKSDTLIQALYPHAMEEDWLLYNSETEEYKNSRGSVKIIEVLSPSLVKAEIQFNSITGTKYFIKVISEQESSRMSHPLQLHFQRLYRRWFAAEYEVITVNNQIVDDFLFTEHGNAEGYIDNSLYKLFLWDEKTTILSLENWKTKSKTYYILTFNDSAFVLEQIIEPEWCERPKPLRLTGNKILLKKKKKSP